MMETTRRGFLIGAATVTVAASIPELVDVREPAPILDPVPATDLRNRWWIEFADGRRSFGGILQMANIEHNENGVIGHFDLTSGVLTESGVVAQIVATDHEGHELCTMPLDQPLQVRLRDVLHVNTSITLS